MWYIYQLGIHISGLAFNRFVLSGELAATSLTHQHSGTAGAALLPSKIYYLLLSIIAKTTMMVYMFVVANL